MTANREPRSITCMTSFITRTMSTVTSLMAEANSFGLAQPQFFSAVRLPTLHEGPVQSRKEHYPCATTASAIAWRKSPIPPTAEAAGPFETR